MTSLLIQMAKGEVRCHKILESAKFMAVLEPRPIREGHAIVFPKKEEDYLFSLSDADLSELMIFAKEAAQKVQRAVPCVKIGVMVAGLKLRHVHIHLIPIQDVSDLDFSKQKPASDSQLAETAAKINAE